MHRFFAVNDEKIAANERREVGCFAKDELSGKNAVLVMMALKDYLLCSVDKF